MDAIRPASSLDRPHRLLQGKSNSPASTHAPFKPRSSDAAVVRLSRIGLEASAAILSAVYNGEGRQSGLAPASSMSSAPGSAAPDLFQGLDSELRQEALSLSALTGGGSMGSMLDGMTEFINALSSGASQAARPGQPAWGEQAAAQTGGGQTAASMGSFVHFQMSAEAHFTSTTVTSSENGETIETRTADFQFEIEFSQLTVQAQNGNQQGVQTSDPLVLDLDRDGIISVSDPSQGLLFDLTGDGVKEHSAFVSGADGFLVLDRNKNGRLDSGSELFGDQNGSADGFLELSKFDSNNDGKIDAADAVFSDLLIARRDSSGDITLHSLGEYNIRSLDLHNRETHQDLSGGSYLSAVSSYTTEDGSKGLLADAQLAYRA